MFSYLLLLARCYFLSHDIIPMRRESSIPRSKTTFIMEPIGLTLEESSLGIDCQREEKPAHGERVRVKEDQENSNTFPI